MKHLKKLILNESLNRKELLSELKNSKYIYITYLGKEDGWGVIYYIDGIKKQNGGFNSMEDVHNYLIENDIDYGSKSSHEIELSTRDKKYKNVSYKGYQKELLSKNLEDLFDL